MRSALVPVVVLCLLSAGARPAAGQQQTPPPPATVPPGSAAAVTSNVPPPPPAAPAAPETTWSQVRVNEPVIALTFDDGPHPTLTPQLLDLLAQRKIHATFFVVGQMVKDHPEILQRALREGHEIANHSFTHPNLAKMSEDGVRRELTGTKDLITNAIARPVTLMRPPYGSLSNGQKKLVHGDLGYKIILWDVDPLDWKDRNSGTVARRILEGTHKGSIILAHDIHKTTVDAMPTVLDGLLAKGFRFVTVSELLAMELPPDPKTPRPVAAKTRPMPPSGVPDKLTGAPEVPTPAPAPTPLPARAPAPRP